MVIERAVMALVLVFMVGSLLGLGLQLALGQAITALRNVRFVLLIVFWGWVVGPAFAWFLVWAIPMEEPYGIGLLLLGMAPCAPFVPMMAEKARGDLPHTGAILVLTAVGTVVFMPFAVPLMAPPVTADAWAIGKPLVLYVLAPLALGIAIKDRAPGLAQAVYPAVKRITNLATVLMLAGMAIVYGRAMIGAIGSFAIGTLIVYCGVLMAAAYRIGPGLAENQRSVLGLGMGTRNIGAAIAPLVAAAGTDPRALVMCVIAMPVTVGLAAVAARFFARRAAIAVSEAHAG